MNYRAALAATLCFACGGTPQIEDGKLRVTLRLVNDDGSRVREGQVQGTNFTVSANASGEAQLLLDGPDLLVVGGPDVLPEPVVVGNRDHRSPMTVRLWRHLTGTGARRAMHFGGDVMFGRRYSEPTSGEPLLIPGQQEAGATHVVERVARAFEAANFSAVNLETVVSNLPLSDAYPGKRFLLNSPPESLKGLDRLGVDLVGLANNHTRDWLEPGLVATLDALDAHGIPHVGAGLDEASAQKPATVDLAGLRVAMLAYTSVNGSYVNDNYPTDAAAAPARVAGKDAWIWEPRPFSSDFPGFSLTAGRYRVGELWQRFAAVEEELSTEVRDAAWSALTAVYPELQDWVARRGHGGAAYYVSSHVKAELAQVKASADIAVVLLHAGYQFQDVASETVVTMAHTTIDAGADLVVCHHPHVLQGVEYYKGKLIIYSLGNFVFDQDFLSTFSSGFLRTIWEGNRMLEARFVPVEIADYRPSVVADEAADRIFSHVWESSLATARAARVTSGVYPIVRDDSAAAADLGFIREWGTVRFSQEAALHSASLSPKHDAQALPKDRVLRVALDQSTSTLRGWSLGRELLGWGHFEDVLADGVPAFGENYVFDHADKLLMLDGAPRGNAYLRLKRDAKKKDPLYIRPVARVALPQHRLYRPSGEDVTPVDPAPTYSIRALVRGKGNVQARFRVDTFHFDDSNPTEDPSSQALATLNLPIDNVSSQFEQRDIPVVLSPSADGTIPNMIMLYVGLAPPDSGEAEFDFDDVEWVEWRSASGQSGAFGAYNYAKSAESAGNLAVEWLSTLP